MDAAGQYHWNPGDSPCRWRSPIHMPRWASRITLEISDTYQQRLGDMAEADAKAEGVDSLSEFRELWTHLHGTWDPGLAVRVIEFRVVKEIT